MSSDVAASFTFQRLTATVEAPAERKAQENPRAPSDRRRRPRPVSQPERTTRSESSSSSSNSPIRNTPSSPVAPCAPTQSAGRRGQGAAPQVHADRDRRRVGQGGRLDEVALASVVLPAQQGFEGQSVQDRVGRENETLCS